MHWKNKRKTFFEKRDAKEQWHNWFAWHPVRIAKYMVWLEQINRKGKWHCSDDGGWEWKYRTIKHPSGI